MDTKLCFKNLLFSAVLIFAAIFSAGCAGGGAQGIAGSQGDADRLAASGGSSNGQKPVPVPEAEPLAGGFPMNAHFFGLNSFDPDGEVVKWEWNFADGNPGEQAWVDYSDTLGEAWHVFSNPGTKVAQLRVTDNDGKSAVGKVKITLRHDLNADPIAAASAIPLEAETGDEISFSALGSYDPDGSIVAWEWDFGEGSGYQDCSATSGAAAYAYLVGGLYKATLRVSDDDGARGYASVDLVITDHPSSSPWSMFRHDPRHTGRSSFAGPQGGVVDWSYNAGALIFSSPSIGPDGTVYVGSGSWNSGNFYAFEPDGTLKWSFSAGGVECSPAIGPDGTIYIGSGIGKMYALDDGGSLKWEYSTGNIIGSSPVLAPDGTVYFGNRSGYLYALNQDGTLKWQQHTGAWVYGSPALADDGTIYIGSRGLIAYAPDGTELWRNGTYGVHWSSPAVADEGTIYIGSTNNFLYAVNPDGSTKWQVNGPGGRSSPAIGADGSVYVRGGNNFLYSVSAEGVIQWQQLTGFLFGDWTSSSPAIGADGMVYVGGWDLQLHAYSASGSVAWKYMIGAIVGSSPCIGPDGALYVGANNGRFYCFKN